MTLLTLNAGSSSLKFSVWVDRRLRWRGQIEQIGGRARLTIGQTTRAITAPTMTAAVKHVHTLLAARGLTPNVVVHRIVHGGDWYTGPARLTPTVMQRLNSIIHLAPLHLPVNLTVVRLAQRHWRQSQAWGVFDTGLYHDLPVPARLYALPLAISRKFKLRKYGFHGTSHAWAFQQAAQRLHRPARTLNAVTLHLGAGDSLTNWRAGRVTDTSMGFTPLAGVVMATRAGDIDPMIPLYLQTHGGWSAKQVAAMLNYRSGTFGLIGLKDMRDILEAAGHRVPGWPHRRWSATQRARARQGLHIYIYSLQRYLRSYAGLTPRLDAIIFTGAIGKNPTIQRLICQDLTRPRSVRIMTIPSNEEQAMAEAVQARLK